MRQVERLMIIMHATYCPHAVTQLNRSVGGISCLCWCQCRLLNSQTEAKGKKMIRWIKEYFRGRKITFVLDLLRDGCILFKNFTRMVVEDFNFILINNQTTYC